MARYAKMAAIVVAFIGFLALASYFTTSIHWDGGFPAGEFRVNVRDVKETPVKGATLRVYHGGTRELAFNYPLDNQLPGHDLVSDDHGRITAIRMSDRMQFGGHAWQLFWVIPMGAKEPKFDCEITAEGFQPITFPVDLLFGSPTSRKTKVKVDGKDIELRIYEQSLNLKP